MTVREGIDHLTPRERSRLAAILARLSSPFENERAVAGLLASAFVAARGLRWADLAALLTPAPAPPPEAGPGPPPTVTDRRRGRSNAWPGYCRRRPAAPDQAPGRAFSRLV